MFTSLCTSRVGAAPRGSVRSDLICVPAVYYADMNAGAVIQVTESPSSPDYLMLNT
jgi:hypothetical protein